jgi:hypothetical protein
MARRTMKTAVPRENAGTFEQQIAALANALWRERGCPEGSPEHDWFQAEQQLQRGRNTEIVKVVRRARRTSDRVAV